MKYLPDITFKEGMQIGVSLGTAIGIFLIGTFLATALTSKFVGNPTNAGGVTVNGVTPETWSRKYTPAADDSFKSVGSPQAIADSEAARALEAMRWKVFQELQKTIRNSLPTAVADDTPPAGRNIEYMEVVADKNGASTSYTNRELVYDELKGDVKRMLDARFDAQAQEDLQGNYGSQLLEENMQLKADDNAAFALAVTNEDVVRNLNRSVQQMILSPIQTDNILEIAKGGQVPYKTGTVKGSGSSYTRVSWNNRDE